MAQRTSKQQKPRKADKMSHELLKQVAEITNKKTTKLSATEVLELQICASVLDFIDDVGSVEELRAKVNSFLKGKK
jgi:hypothetical protein